MGLRPMLVMLRPSALKWDSDIILSSEGAVNSSSPLRTQAQEKGSKIYSGLKACNSLCYGYPEIYNESERGY